MAPPTLVLVHGSWHSPEHFGPLIRNLDSHGFKCVPAALPSTQSADLPPANFADDTAAVRDTVLKELETNNVVVAAHSYGGAPTNNALEGLDVASRKAAGDSTAVTAIVFICSFPFGKGVSMLEILGGHPAPIHNIRGDFAYVIQRTRMYTQIYLLMFWFGRYR
jgi:pimeloyl-ACP methyl ester carboxylesterase